MDGLNTDNGKKAVKYILNRARDLFLKVKIDIVLFSRTELFLISSFKPLESPDPKDQLV